MRTFNEEKQDKKVEELLEKEAEDLAVLLSQKYGLPYINLISTSINTDALRLVDETTARNALISPFKLVGNKVHTAIFTLENKATKSSLEDLKQKGYVPILYMASKKSLEHAWERYIEVSRAEETKAGVLDISSKELSELVKRVHTTDDVNKIINETLQSKERQSTSHIFEVILAGGLSIGASDVHIEPEETSIRLRFRLDGVLHDISFFTNAVYQLLLSRIKLISGLKLNIKDTAQDGRFSISIGDLEIEIRTSTLPGAYGESVVMRILNPKEISVPLESLGVEPFLLSVIENEIAKPNGMILVTGPTGSGKTTTLYAFLRKIYSPDIKIITIEDPIEYHLKEITQTQTDPAAGYDFLKGLTSALRQDPDVIMVGEICEGETARTAINAALTGHLVLSTLHTNNAAGTIPRLIDLGVEPKVLGSAINIFLAQRLVRKLCPSCKKEATPTKEEKELIERVLQTIPREHPKTAEKIWRAGSDCFECNNTGYKGRIGIFEGILFDESIEKTVSEHVSAREIKKAASGQGILDMLQDGIMKVLSGVTSLDELARVVDVNER
ncbi:MAG: type II/IV secretion system protein [Candidatus Lloydbacteria bacterium]|nr:type II/IV secretion system protein [Candidatus Lloydbacteria bacterium]